MNLGVVIWLVLGAASMGIDAAAWGVTSGVVAMLAVILLYPVKERLVPRIERKSLKTTGRILGLALVLVLFGTGGGFLMLATQRFFYALLPAGHLTQLEYAFRIGTLPSDLVLPAVMTTVLPAMSAAVAERGAEEAHRLANKAMRAVLATTVPVTVGLAVVGPEMVSLLLGRGAFGPDAVAATGVLLVAFVPAIILSLARAVLVNVFFSRKSVVFPAVVGVAGVLVFAAAATLTWESYGGVGMALSLALAQGANVVALAVQARREYDQRWPDLPVFLGRLGASVAVAAGGAWGCTQLVPSLGMAPSSIAIVASAGVAFALVFLGACKLFGLSEVTDVLRAIRGRMRRGQT
jgi:putative peptidoglycan lipid II flippase